MADEVYDWDYYADALLAVIRLHADWSEANAAKYDFSILDGGIDRAVIITPGETEDIQKQGGGARVRGYEFVTDFLERIAGKSDVDAWTGFVAAREGLIRHLESYPTLNEACGVLDVTISTSGRPLGIPAGSGDDESFIELFQELTIVAAVRYVVTGGEYGS